MKRTLCLFSVSNLIVLTGFLAGPGVAEAQLVQVGPGYVKAPFVRVYQTPNGTFVRAPFTRIEPSAPAYDHQFDQRPNERPDGEPLVDGYDKGDATSLMERQRRLVASSARRLNRDLTKFRTGDLWQAFLRLPPDIMNEHSVAGHAPMVQPEPIAVQDALINFDTVASNEQYRRISQLNSFLLTHRLLREYVSLLSPPIEDPVPPGAAGFDDRSILVWPPVERAPEELRLPELQAPR